MNSSNILNFRDDEVAGKSLPQQELSHEPCRCQRAEKTIELKLAGRVVVTDADEIAIVDFKSPKDNQLEERNYLARRRPENCAAAV